MQPEALIIRPFQHADQPACRALVLAGLEEHWGWLDLTLNPDLDDIAATYRGGVFLTAWLEGDLVGTGALLPAGPGVYQVARMSVVQRLRGHGLGRRILSCLEEHARGAGAARLVLETTATWEDAVAFYLRCGYTLTHHQDGDVFFEKKI